jgi:hypothetical protein
MNADQSSIKGFSVTFDGSNTHWHFTTTHTELVPSYPLIWAFCNDDHTTALA